MHVITFYDLLEQNLEHRADHVALIDRDQQVTYGQVAQRAGSLAAWLQGAGVGRGDRVAIQLPNGIDHVVAMFAVARLGAVFVNIYSQWKPEQTRYVMADCDVRVLITDARSAQQLVQLELPRSLSRIVVRGPAPEHPLIESLDQIPPARHPDRTTVIDRDLAALLYTSGSTGRPKGVMLTHLNLIQGARSVATYLNNRPEDRLLGLLPLSFDYGLNQLTTMFLVGGTLVPQAVPMVTEIARALRTHAITGFAGIPPTWVELVRLLQEHPVEFPQLRYVTNSGGVIPEKTLRRMPEVLAGTEIYLMYGLTEAFRSTYLPPDMLHERLGSMGKAIPNVEVFVVDAETGLCAPGEPGELLHRGSLISQGYWGDPAATAAKIRTCPHLSHLIGDEKVLYSGDIVRADEDGYLWFVGRGDAMIKCSGVRISPTEVEDFVCQSGMVAHAVAFGVPDEDRGSVVHVAVTPHSDESFDVHRLMAYCREQMPPYMVPHEIHCWEGEMPRTGSGKLDAKHIAETVRSRIAQLVS
jgi:acyl-CoA ligase (AMP-forming) (exosortase A-associated)